MTGSTRHALVLRFLVLAAGLNQGWAEVKPSIMVSGPPPRSPLGVYAVVPVEDVVANECSSSTTTAAVDTCLTGFYAGLLNNAAISGLTLQIHWDTLNPNAPADPQPYFWNYVDDAFTSVRQWNTANPGATAKTVQLIVTPGLNSPQWVRDQLTSCDNLFTSTPPLPTSSCGMATFAATKEKADSTVLPMPWNKTYKADWKTFLTALAAKYGSDAAFVSIAVAGPTAASAEMILPNSADDKDKWGQLLKLHYPGKSSYWNTDQAFVDEWNAAIDMYGEVFSGLTLVATTGDGLPNLTGSYTTPPLFAGDCTHPSNMDCAAETTILTHFTESSVGGNNGKATQTSGMEAGRVGLNLGIDGVRNLSQETMTKLSASTRIFGGGQFSTRFSIDTAEEGCTSKFPPDGYSKADDVPVKDIPTACLAPGVTTADLTAAGFTFFNQKKEASYLISPEQAAYNVLEFYFNYTPAATHFGGTTGAAPLNYLQIYYQDIQYSTNNASNKANVVQTDGTTVSESAQDLLSLASTQVLSIAEAEPSCPPGASCPR